MDGRRHSIDVPISRTLIALRRVRSLRDPCTSMSKPTPSVDNVNWHTNLTDAITLGLEVTHCRVGDNEHKLHFGSTNGQELGSDATVFDVKALSERYCTEYGDRYFEFTSTAPSGEGNASIIEVSKRPNGKSKREIWTQSSTVSPCFSDGFLDSGCGMSSCWSRGKKSRDDYLEQPLLPENRATESFDSRLVSLGVSPRSLSQKFTPKSFNELVGQSNVSTSLLNAISSNQISSLYLFYGPRGTGKTATARIFAAALNCLSLEATKPCGLCRECSGSRSDVKGVDTMRINRMKGFRSLMKNARIPPVFSRFKVYIIEECHLMRREAWSGILNGVEELPRHVVFIMVTPYLDRIPRSALSKCRKHHFPKVGEVDIVSKLGRMCVEEGLEFDIDALNFVATRSNGSLRDAEMMLDHLSLLGKKITISLVHEVFGVVSDDELLDLLHLALSSDASNTVKKARELMQSRIDPLQLTSQLASLIMDILVGKYGEDVSGKRRKLFATDKSEDEMQQLSHALKVLSQTEKQLRVSNNRTTWLTVVLLQLSSSGPGHDGGDPRLSTRSSLPKDSDCRSSSSTGESFKRSVACACVDATSASTGTEYDEETLELVWIRTAGSCTSHSLKKFLIKRGSLVSICLTRGIAVTHLEFNRSEYVFKAEKSWKEIAGALQRILGYNVELRIKLRHDDSNKKFKKPCLNLFNCSRSSHLRPQSSTDSGSTTSETSDSTPSTVRTRDKYVETCFSESGPRISCSCCHGKGMFKTIRSSDGNALSIEADGLDDVGVQSKPRSKDRFHCLRAATFPFRKAWQLRHHHYRNEHLADYALHCAAAY